MRKTLLASAIALSALSSINAHADIAITTMSFGTTNYAAGGTLISGGGGNMFSIDPFFYHSWTATQETSFLTTADTWAGVSAQGAFDYSADIAAMTAAQAAVGIYFNWNGNNEIAVLEIFNCVAMVCTGQGVPMQNGPFGGTTGSGGGGTGGLEVIAGEATAGAIASFSGTGSLPSVIPVPAAVWLMASGMLGFIGLARRRTQA